MGGPISSRSSDAESHTMKQKRLVLSKLIGLTGLIYILGAAASGLLAFSVIRESMGVQIHQKLEAVLKSRATLVEDYFRLNQEQVRHLAQNAMIVRATKGLSGGFAELAAELDLSADVKGALSADLTAFYERELDSTPAALRQGRAPEALFPRSEAGRLAQWVYLAKNPNRIGSRNELLVSPHASTYEQAHRDAHPKLNQFLKAFDFRDILLFDLAGNLVYSTQKEIDFGSNLVEGPHSGTALGQVYRAAMASSAREVATSDFEAYLPSYGEPAAFFATPVYEEQRRVGVVVFQINPTRLNTVVADVHGLGDSGETYIVGDDLTMRTDSRFADSSTILSQRVETRASTQAIAGHAGSASIADYRGVEVLSHYRPLMIAGLTWGLIAEVDKADVEAPAVSLAWKTVLVFIVTLGVVALVSMGTLRLAVVRPMTQLLAAARKFRGGDYGARVHVASDDEFGLLAESHNQMAEAVQEQVTELKTTLANVKELYGLLPICACCKSIRGDDGYFRTVETYLVGKSKLEFSHTICEDCLPKLYPELDDILGA
jgi:methyl-accepting chemotaxis protein